MIADLTETRAKLLPLSDSTEATNPIERVCDAIEAVLRPTSADAARTPPSNV
jgi:hypothetical protein